MKRLIDDDELPPIAKKPSDIANQKSMNNQRNFDDFKDESEIMEESFKRAEVPSNRGQNQANEPQTDNSSQDLNKLLDISSEESSQPQPKAEVGAVSDFARKNMRSEINQIRSEIHNRQGVIAQTLEAIKVNISNCNVIELKFIIHRMKLLMQ